MAHRDDIIALLKRHPQGLDDDEIAKVLRLTQRQTANLVCRQLEREGLIDRRGRNALGKIVNRLRHGGMSNAAVSIPIDLAAHAPAGSGTSAALTRTDQAAAPLPRLTLLDGSSLKAFAYPGERLVSEDSVKKALADCLMADGWVVEVKWGHAPGIDIDARRGSERYVIEVKGEGSIAPARVNYFLGAIGELVQRMRGPDVRYALAFPAHRQFVGLVERLPVWVRGHLNLSIFLVRQDDDARVIGLLPPSA